MLVIELEITGVNQIIKSIYVPLVTMPFSNFFDPSIFFLKQLSFTIIIVTSVTRVQSGTIAATVCHKQKTQICKREKFGLRCLNKKTCNLPAAATLMINCQEISGQPGQKTLRKIVNEQPGESHDER